MLTSAKGAAPDMPKGPQGQKRPADVAGRAVRMSLETPMHSDHRSWLEDAYTESVFSGTGTLDPSSVLRAWERLTQDTWVLEFESLPRTMHAALMRTLKERGGMKHGR